MAVPPVSLQEVRDFLNLTETDGHDGDEELWGKTLAATDMVEARVGPIRPRTVVRTVRPGEHRYLVLPGPVLSVTSVTDDILGQTVVLDPAPLDGDVLWLPYCGPEYRGRYAGSFTVTYVSGRVPLPADLIEAVKIQTGLLWSTQRGPMASARFSGIGGDGVSSPGGIDRLRLDDILGANDRLVFA